MEVLILESLDNIIKFLEILNTVKLVAKNIKIKYKSINAFKSTNTLRRYDYYNERNFMVMGSLNNILVRLYELQQHHRKIKISELSFTTLGPFVVKHKLFNSYINLQFKRGVNNVSFQSQTVKKELPVGNWIPSWFLESTGNKQKNDSDNLPF